MLEVWLQDAALPMSVTTPPALIRMADVGSTYVPKSQRYDKATLGAQIDLDVGNKSRMNFAKAACSFLTRKEVAGWNEASPCTVVTLLNRPTHGTLLGAGEGIYIYMPKTLGKDVIRFIVENTEEKKAIVTLTISVVKSAASINGGNSTKFADTTDLMRWQLVLSNVRPVDAADPVDATRHN